MIELQDFVRKVSNVEEARQALAKIKKANSDGLLTAEDVLEAASHPDHPLHRYFEWDETEAAHQWRLMQARGLIRKVLVSEPDEGIGDAVPKYVSLSIDRKRPGGGYRETREVLNSKQLMEQLEETAKRDIDGILRRYEMLKALCAKVRKAAGIKPKGNRKTA